MDFKWKWQWSFMKKGFRLINNKVPAEQMREIIDFALLENSMKE